MFWNINRSHQKVKGLSSIYNDGYTLEEFANKIEGAYIIDEKPLTAKQNYVLVW